MNRIMTRNLVKAVLLIAGAVSAQVTMAEGDPAEGKLLGFTCMGCHGIEGYRNAYPSFRVPRLGGQNSEYVEAALKAYRDGRRSHPTMMAQGGSLSDEDIENVAAYLQTFGAATDKLDAAAVSGMDAAAMCVTCHGAGAADVQPAPPTLSGQHPDYLARVLRQYRDGERAGNVMVAFAATLSEADIAMLARLYASQDGLHTPLDNK